MAVHAHPDDESSKGAASMVRYVREGADVLVVTCTGGERGDVLNPKLAADPEVLADLAAVRRREMDSAREVLGVRQQWLGFVDSGYIEDYTVEGHLHQLPDGCFARIPVEDAAIALAAVIRDFQPHVVTTYDENGGYPHPDHIMTHVVTMAALDVAADPAAAFDAGPHGENEKLLQPWEVLKVYYHLTFHRQRLEALHEATLAAGLESPFGRWLDEWVDDPADERRLTTRVECGEYFGVRDDALRAHATQVDDEGWWFGVPLTVQTAAWPTEDFELARSAVPTTVPEDDLFAGVREHLVAPRPPTAGE
ncbi:MAG: mycothiol conjugate amidase Mca [Actinomycetes bacterium]